METTNDSVKSKEIQEIINVTKEYSEIYKKLSDCYFRMNEIASKVITNDDRKEFLKLIIDVYCYDTDIEKLNEKIRMSNKSSGI